MYNVQHWIVSPKPRQLVEIYGPYTLKQANKVAKAMNGPDSYDGKYIWEAKVVPA